MHNFRWVRAIKGLAAGAFLLQTGGCFDFQFLLQTIFTGITAAASIAILDSGSF